MRRARIKAVAALPVRRKNNEATKKEAAAKPDTTSEPEAPNPAPSCELGTPNRASTSASEAPKTVVTKPTGNDNITASESPQANEPNSTVSPVHTPRRSHIQTPNLIERSGTPKPKKLGTPQRVSSPHFPRNITLTKVFSPISEAKAQIIGELSTDHRYKPSSVSITSPSKTRAVSPISQAKAQILSDLSTDDRIKPSSISISSPMAALSKPRAVSPISQAKAQILSDLSTDDRIKPSSLSITSPLATVIKPRQKKQTNSPKSAEIHQANEIGGITKIQTYYNPPSIPESVTEDTVLDGIVPLQSNSSQRSSAVPLALLKNEIISENAEVLFDPIIPLPSPSKVRPKLRPAPRLAFRRNSVQGSASESEDESRRALLSAATTPALPRQRHDSHSTQYTLPNREVARVRNDSVCSVVSQATAQQQPPPSTPTLTKERLVSKARRTEMSRRMSALRRRQRGRDKVPRDALTMYDLIFYNPTENPIIPDEPEKPKELPAEPKEAEKPTKAVEETKEAADDPPESAPVPQIKLGPNGEIILDEKSLVIDQTEGPRKLSSSIVHENEWAHNSRGKYSRAPRTADWSDAETVRFYRALAALGTDFTLMESLFPGRTRRDLKLKFKREERSNGAQVDKALRSQIQWDALGLTREFASERQAAAEQAAKQREALLEQKRAERARLRRAKEEGFSINKATKAMEFTVPQGRVVSKSTPTKSNLPMQANTADDIIKRALQEQARGKLKRKNKALDKLPALIPIKNITNTTKSKSPFATLTMSSNDGNFASPHKPPPISDMAQISKTPSHSDTHNAKTPSIAIPLNASLPNVPQNIEQGSLVVLTVNDPNEPTKKMLQTYISHGSGKLTPVALPPTLLNSVMSYMKKGTSSSPQLTSPSSVGSAEESIGRSSVIQINPSPAKRHRHSSFTITHL